MIDDNERVARLNALFDAMPALYVADGHHRSAAASRVTAERKAANPEHNGEEAYNYFLSVIFPHNQMQILDYNRVVRISTAMSAPHLSTPSPGALNSLPVISR